MVSLIARQQLLLLLGGLIAIFLFFIASQIMYASPLQIPLSPPLGYASSKVYSPYPFARFGLQNPHLYDIDTCFTDETGTPIKLPHLFHAGTDWFELNGGSAVGDAITVIADGVVTWVSVDAEYPGEVVIVQHSDPDLGTIYSVYMHLDHSVQVSIGDSITRGTQIGEVITQTRYLEDGTAVDNSHLHWEVRTFADATQQSWFPPSCDGSVAGEGYTKEYPTQYGYMSPDDLLNTHIFLPYISSAPTNTPTPILRPTPTATPTPTPTATPTPIPCVAGVDLVQNGDFEDPTQHDLWISDTPNLINPYPDSPDEYALVMGYENSADQTVYQTITVPPEVDSVDIKFWLYVRTQELLPFDFDYLYIDVVHGNGVTGASLLHEPFDPYTNQFPQGEWRQQTLHVEDIEAIPVPIHLNFHATTNWALATAFYLDNVQLITRCE